MSVKCRWQCFRIKHLNNGDYDRSLTWSIALPKMKVIFNPFAIRIFTVQHALHMKYIFYICFQSSLEQINFFRAIRKKKTNGEKEKKNSNFVFEKLIVSLCFINNDNNSVVISN